MARIYKGVHSAGIFARNIRQIIGVAVLPKGCIQFFLKNGDMIYVNKSMAKDLYSSYENYRKLA